MKVELPGGSKSFTDIEAGECFAFTREQVTSICMKVEWLSSASVAVLWSASDDWTVPHLIAPTELAGSILHSLPSAVFVASSDAKDVRADRTRHEYAPGFLIKTPTGQPLIAVKGLQREHGISVIDVSTILEAIAVSDFISQPRKIENTFNAHQHMIIGNELPQRP
jgi:hypothetical protein